MCSGSGGAHASGGFHGIRELAGCGSGQRDHGVRGIAQCGPHAHTDGFGMRHSSSFGVAVEEPLIVSWFRLRKRGPIL